MILIQRTIASIHNALDDTDQFQPDKRYTNFSLIGILLSSIFLDQKNLVILE